MDFEKYLTGNELQIGGFDLLYKAGAAAAQGTDPGVFAPGDVTSSGPAQDGCRYSPPEGSVFTSYLGRESQGRSMAIQGLYRIGPPLYIYAICYIYIYMLNICF